MVGALVVAAPSSIETPVVVVVPAQRVRRVAAVAQPKHLMVVRAAQFQVSLEFHLVLTVAVVVDQMVATVITARQMTTSALIQLPAQVLEALVAVVVVKRATKPLERAPTVRPLLPRLPQPLDNQVPVVVVVVPP